jgi:putative SOS response-associated peptidase YedK
MLRWGLVPFWADDVDIANRLINARSESASSKPAFRAAFRKRRCLVPADGFYEWVKTSEGKRPVYIRRRDRKPLAFAGLWERWKESDEQEEPLETYTILTGAANELLKRLHERMPLMLGERAWEAWLDPGNDDVDALEALLDPIDARALEAHPVSRRVNSPRNEEASLIEPVEDDEVARIIAGDAPGDGGATLFSDVD